MTTKASAPKPPAPTAPPAPPAPPVQQEEQPKWPAGAKRHLISAGTAERLEKFGREKEEAERLYRVAQANINGTLKTIADEAKLGEIELHGIDDSKRGSVFIVYTPAKAPKRPGPAGPRRHGKGR